MIGLLVRPQTQRERNVVRFLREADYMTRRLQFTQGFWVVLYFVGQCALFCFLFLSVVGHPLLFPGGVCISFGTALIRLNITFLIPWDLLKPRFRKTKRKIWKTMKNSLTKPERLAFAVKLVYRFWNPSCTWPQLKRMCERFQNSSRSKVHMHGQVSKDSVTFFPQVSLSLGWFMSQMAKMYFSFSTKTPISVVFLLFILLNYWNLTNHH